jgi:hypothetical protein
LKISSAYSNLLNKICFPPERNVSRSITLTSWSECGCWPWIFGRRFRSGVGCYLKIREGVNGRMDLNVIHNNEISLRGQVWVNESGEIGQRGSLSFQSISMEGFIVMISSRKRVSSPNPLSSFQIDYIFGLRR